MPNKDNTYTATTIIKLFDFPEDAGVLAFDTHSEESTPPPAIDKDGFLDTKIPDVPEIAQGRVDKLLNHPVSVSIDPCSAISINKYKKLVAAVLGSTKGIHLPLPYQQVSSRRTKLDRFKWSYKWYKGDFFQFLELAGRLVEEFKHRAIAPSIEPWETIETFITLQKISSTSGRFAVDNLSYPLDSKNKVMLSRFLYTFLKHHKPADIDDKLLFKTADKLQKLCPDSLDALAFNAFEALIELGGQWHNHFVISPQGEFPCRESIGYLCSGGKELEFPVECTISCHGYPKRRSPFGCWRVEIEKKQNSDRFKVVSKWRTFGDEKEPYSKTVNREKILRFLLLWCVGEVGAFILRPSKDKKSAPGKCDKKVDEILFENQIDKKNEVYCIRYTESGGPKFLPGKMAIKGPDRLFAYVFQRDVNKILGTKNNSVNPLLMPTEKVPANLFSKHFSDKICLLSSLIHLSINDETLSEIGKAINSRNTHLNNPWIKKFMSDVKEIRNNENRDRTITIKTDSCTIVQ